MDSTSKFYSQCCETPSYMIEFFRTWPKSKVSSPKAWPPRPSATASPSPRAKHQSRSHSPSHKPTPHLDLCAAFPLALDLDLDPGLGFARELWLSDFQLGFRTLDLDCEPGTWIPNLKLGLWDCNFVSDIWNWNLGFGSWFLTWIWICNLDPELETWNAALQHEFRDLDLGFGTTTWNMGLRSDLGLDFMLGTYIWI